MCNVEVMYQGITAVSFSVSRGGDWIDENVSADTGVAVAKVQHIKESSSLLDLASGKIFDIYEEGSEETNVLYAIKSYYGALITYLLTNLKAQFEGTANVPQFQDPVPLIFGGGTALVKGFLAIVNEQFEQDNFPIQVSEIKIIEDAHTAVSRGCLSESQIIEEEENETD